MTAEQVRERLQLASALYSQQDWQQAADAYGDLFIEPAALAGAGHDGRELHWNYAICLHHLGRDELAIQHLQAGGFSEAQYAQILHPHHGVQGTPEDQFVERQHYAVQLFHGQQFGESAAVYRELLADPSLSAEQHSQLCWNLAMCLGNEGYWDDAVAAAQAGGYAEHDLAQQLPHVHDERAQRQFAHATELIHAQQWEAAAEAFATLLVSPGHSSQFNDASVHVNVALCYMHLENWPLAREHAQAGGMGDAEFESAAVAAGLHPPAH